MSARCEAYSHRGTLPAFKSVWVLGVFWVVLVWRGFWWCFLLLLVFGFLTAKQGFAVAWTEVCLFLFHLSCPCQGLGFLSSGGEKKMSLMSCAAELSAKSSRMDVLFSPSLHCCNWCSSGASLPGKAFQEVLKGQGSL